MLKWEERAFNSTWVAKLTPGLELVVFYSGGIKATETPYMVSVFRERCGAFATLEEAKKKAEEIALERFKQAMKAWA